MTPNNQFAASNYQYKYFDELLSLNLRHKPNPHLPFFNETSFFVGIKKESPTSTRPRF